MRPFLKPVQVKWIILALVALYASGAEGQYASIDWVALNRGEVIIEEVTTVAGVPGVRAHFTVMASREEIWSTLLDYENFPIFFKGVKKLKVLEQNEKGARVEFWVNAVLMDLNYILYRDYAKPNYRLTWHRVAGDLDDIHGSWQILETENPEKKLIIYESYVDIGFSMITWAIRQGAKRKAEAMSYRLRGWLESKQ